MYRNMYRHVQRQVYGHVCKPVLQPVPYSEPSWYQVVSGTSPDHCETRDELVAANHPSAMQRDRDRDTRTSLICHIARVRLSEPSIGTYIVMACVVMAYADMA